jgi:hypothetical protein
MMLRNPNREGESILNQTARPSCSTFEIDVFLVDVFQFFCASVKAGESCTEASSAYLNERIATMWQPCMQRAAHYNKIES